MNKKAIIIAPRALYVCAPAFDAEPDDEGWYGHVITCTEKLDGGWYKIVTPYRYETYAHKDDMLFDKAEIARREGEDTKLLRVWALAGDVHTEATHNGNVLITLYRGAIVEKIEDENVRAGWTHVRLYGGAEGWARITISPPLAKKSCATRLSALQSSTSARSIAGAARALSA